MIFYLDGTYRVYECEYFRYPGKIMAFCSHRYCGTCIMSSFGWADDGYVSENSVRGKNDQRDIHPVDERRSDMTLQDSEIGFFISNCFVHETKTRAFKEYCEKVDECVECPLHDFLSKPYKGKKVGKTQLVNGTFLLLKETT